MSSNPPPKLSADWLKQTTETTGNFIRWIAELIQRGNWYMLLVLSSVVLSSLSILLRQTVNAWLPDEYEAFVWIGVAVVVILAFSCALGVAVTTARKLRQQEIPEVTERKSIKGLRPFSPADSVVFARLQRHQMIRECLDFITSDPFRFGILMGDSGCGKTSFLQAGLLTQLSNVHNPHQGIYVRFSDESPLESVRRAFSSQLQLSQHISKDATFLQMLEIAVASSDTPLVLMFDQFEQFFIHHTTDSSRTPFIHALASWYNSSRLSAVKIIVSIRSDLRYQLHDVHKALGCHLGPQDEFLLKKFTPTEAARVLSVIAETEHLECDEQFVEELFSQELAGREDGLISPVDLQILSWMIDRQGTNNLRAFNRVSFLKFGGVEGLLNRFLEQALSSRVLPIQRQAAIEVMLALVDLDRQVRIGYLTISELQEKTRGTLKLNDVTEAVQWLSQSGVRLITPNGQLSEPSQSSLDKMSYELAHERIIPALMRLAGKELTQLDKTTQLLERRVNEWLGNQCSSRFLLSLSEIWLIHRQRAHIIWGTKMAQKKALVEQSIRYTYQAAVTVAVWLVAGAFSFNIASRFLSGGLDSTLGMFLIIPFLLATLVMTNSFRSVGTKRFIPVLSVTVIFIGILSLSFWYSVPEISSWYNRKGLMNHQLGRLSHAESDYKRAIALAPGNSDAHYNLGTLYEDRQLFDKAMQAYQNAINNGEIIEAFNNLARLRISQTGNDYQVAAELLQQGLSLAEKKSTFPETQYSLFKNLGWVRLQQGQLLESIDFIGNRALRLGGMY